MSLTIYTAINRDYFLFGKIFLFSLIENFPNEKIKKIVINDLGLDEEQKAFIKKISNKIEFLKTTDKIITTGFKIHTKSWRKAVSQKTIGLHQLCQDPENFPIVMLDCDMYVLSDFSSEIHESSDVQICKRPKLVTHYYNLDYIACWFVANNINGKDFVESWIRSMPYIRGGHAETPAMCSTVYMNRNNYNIVENDSKIVASLNCATNPKIIHFKSKGLVGNKNQNILQRILNVQNIPAGLGKKIAEFWEKNDV